MGELLREAFRDVAADPKLYLAEVVQVALVVAGVWWFGRRYAARRLAARLARVNAAVDAAEADEREAARLRAEAPTLVETAKREAAAFAHDAAARLAAERQTAASTTAEQVAKIAAQARATVEEERARVDREAADRLVRLTTEATRAYLDTMLTDDERRAVTRSAIARLLDELEREPAHAAVDGGVDGVVR